MFRSVAAAMLLSVNVTLIARGDTPLPDNPGTPPEVPALQPNNPGAPPEGIPATQPASAAASEPVRGLPAQASDGFVVELVGVRYEGDADLSAGKYQAQVSLHLSITAPKDVPGMRLAAWDLTSVLDDGGQDLRARWRPMAEGDALRRALTGVMQQPWQSATVRSFAVPNLTAMPRRLQGIKGKIIMLVPGAAVSKDLGPLELGPAQEVATGLTAQIEGVDATVADRVKVTVTCRLHGGTGAAAPPYAAAQLDCFDVLDAQGRKLLVPAGGWEKTARWAKTDDGWKVTGSITVGKGKDQAPKALRIHAYTGIKDKVVTFEFPEIALSTLLRAPPSASSGQAAPPAP